MRIERLALHRVFDVFPGTVDLNLRDVPPGLIALVGPNGQGKTALMEVIPGVTYRQLPARDGDDPVLYALGRDSWLQADYTFDGVGSFRARVNLDGPKRQSDAVLQKMMPHPSGCGAEWAPLNDGKRSTYDDVIKQTFPSLDLFVSSAFAAQGRGDEFTRRKPSQRKDLFTEFLSLQHLLAMAKQAGDAAELCADARLRLEVRQETLERETWADVVDELDRRAKELQNSGGGAEIRQRELQATIADLEARLAVMADAVAAFAAASQRMATIERELSARRFEQKTVSDQMKASWKTVEDEVARIEKSRDDAVQDAANKIAGNQQIQELAPKIREAVTAIASVENGLATLRSTQATTQQALDDDKAALRAAERDLAKLVPIEQSVTRAKNDAALLGAVPCGGAGEYASCQFLVNATAAAGRIPELEQSLGPKVALADRIAQLSKAIDEHVAVLKDLEAGIAKAEQTKATHAKMATYEAPLAAAEARIKELIAAQAKATKDAQALSAEAQTRHNDRLAQLQASAATIEETVVRLAGELETAQADLTRTTDTNREALALQQQLAAARAERDTVIAAIAAAQHGRQELERRRAELADKRTRLDDVRRRRAAIEQEMVEWQDLAKSLGKGGLPDLEIDAAGPSISALANTLLTHCFGPQFSLELVTQTAKADGGMKDDFTVRVFNNAEYGGWRDIRMLSGGQKVIVQEALMLAIALYVNERSPMPIRTLWRDESGAALDPENAVHYVAMLRKARELGGFHHVFYVSHTPAAQALADVQIQVGGGNARIVYPPFSEAA